MTILYLQIYPEIKRWHLFTSHRGSFHFGHTSDDDCTNVTEGAFQALKDQSAPYPVRLTVFTSPPTPNLGILSGNKQVIIL